MIYTRKLHDALSTRGVESFLPPDGAHLSDRARFEPPCALKFAQAEHGFDLGAFSYVVSGFCCEVTIGRYVSIGEAVQIGRGAHPTSWMSTSPFFYCGTDRMFQVGPDFAGSERYFDYRSSPVPPTPSPSGRTVPNFLRRTSIGNDVWIGHGSFVSQGVVVGDGAVVAGHSVVTRDVPPYAIVAGNPAEIKGFRFDARRIGRLLELGWWRFAPWDLKDIVYNDIDRTLAQLSERVPRLSPFQPDWIEVASLA